MPSAPHLARHGRLHFLLFASLVLPVTVSVRLGMQRLLELNPASIFKLQLGASHCNMQRDLGHYQYFTSWRYVEATDSFCLS